MSSDDSSFTSGFEAGQHLADLLRTGGPQPALSALAVGLLEGLRDGAAQAAVILKDKLQHELNESKLEREHHARQAAYSRRVEDYTREHHGTREDA